jgi:hypothetical protein
MHQQGFAEWVDVQFHTVLKAIICHGKAIACIIRIACGTWG